MNCREYIIEFEERGTLSEPATLHLTICADCKKLSDRQTQIWLLIDDLKPVAAPSDFDFHVKARIAQAKPSDFQSPRFLPILRYVLPLSIVVLLLSLFAFSSMYFSGTESSPLTAQSVTTAPPTPPTSAINSFSADQTTAGYSEPEAANRVEPTARENSPVSRRNIQLASARIPVIQTTRAGNSRSVAGGRRVRRQEKTDDLDSGGGSRVSALTKQEPRLPVGFNANANTAAAPKIDAPQQIDEAQTLAFFGIETTTQNGIRTVSAVVKDSLAERSGVKIGDVIESLRKNTLTVRRGTEKLEITLQSQLNR